MEKPAVSGREGEGMSKKLSLDTESGDVKLQPMYKVGYRAGVEDSYEAARKAWPTALRECQADKILDAIYNLLAEQEEQT